MNASMPKLKGHAIFNDQLLAILKLVEISLQDIYRQGSTLPYSCLSC